MKTPARYILALSVSLLLAQGALAQQAIENPGLLSERTPEEIQHDRSVLARFGPGTQNFIDLRMTGPEDAETTGPLSVEAAIYQLTEQIAQDWDPAAAGGAGDWLNSSRVAYMRNSAGFVTQRLFEDWDSDAGAWTPGLRNVYELNDQNRTVQTLTESWNADANGGQGAWETAQRDTYTHDGQGNTLVSTTEFWDESSGDYFLYRRTTYTYDNGRVVQQVVESTSFITGMFGFSLRYNFEYDGAGRTTLRIIESYSTGAWENSSRREWTYDGNGEETEDLELDWDEAANGGQGAWVNDYREVSTYTPNSSDPTGMTITAQDWDPAQGVWVNRDRGLLSLSSPTEWIQTEQDWDPAANGGQGDWVNRDQQITTLTPDGDFLEFLDQTWDPAANGGQGDWVNEERGTFEYNAQGLISVNTNQIWDGAQWVNESRLLQNYEEYTGTAVQDTGPEVQYRLQANYPNPFSRETAIRFSLPQTEHVTLDVYDLLGRRVTTLVDGLTAPGEHEVVLEAGGMAGGLYVYRLQSDNVRISRTMLLLK